MSVRVQICKFSGLLASVLFIQCCLGKPLEENALKSELSPWPENITEDNITEYFVNHTIKASRQILSDASVIANHNKEVEEFKLNLTTIVNRYEKINSEMDNNQNEDQTNTTIKYEEGINKIMEHFLNITVYYSELPEEKMTNDSKFISDILTKYDGYYVYTQTLAYVIAEAIAEAFEEIALNSTIALNSKEDIMAT